MSELSPNITDELDPPIIALYQIVGAVAKELGIPFVVVGMTMRELVLCNVHAARIEPQMAEGDFAIEVPDWHTFQSLKDALLDLGFTATQTAQRVISPENVILEIFAFLDNENDPDNITWSPDNVMQIQVPGFQEVFDNAELIEIQETPEVSIRVATPAGMAILKLIAWLEGSIEIRAYHAGEFHYLLNTYKNIPTVSDWLYADQQLMEEYDWDIILASACLLGADAGSITSDEIFDTIAEIFNGTHEALSTDDLIDDMSGITPDDYQRNAATVNAFIDGFLDRGND